MTFDQDLLARVLRVLRMPEHAYGQRVDVVTELPDEALDGRGVALGGPVDEVSQRAVVRTVAYRGHWTSSCAFRVTSSTPGATTM